MNRPQPAITYSSSQTAIVTRFVFCMLIKCEKTPWYTR